jgi:hypothetical protein
LGSRPRSAPRIGIENRRYDAAISALVEPVRDRLRRFPNRSLRPEALSALVTGWRFMPPRNWRLSITPKLDRKRAAIVEHRLCAGLLRRPNDPTWTGVESDIAVVRVQLEVDRSTAFVTSRCIATFSLHSVARRLQRHPDGSTEALMHDIHPGAAAACGELVAGGGYKVTTHEDGGGWRGRAIRQTVPDGTQQTVLSIRTWLPA